MKAQFLLVVVLVFGNNCVGGMVPYDMVLGDGSRWLSGWVAGCATTRMGWIRQLMLVVVIVVVCALPSPHRKQASSQAAPVATSFFFHGCHR